MSHIEETLIIEPFRKTNDRGHYVISCSGIFKLLGFYFQQITHFIKSYNAVTDRSHEAHDTIKKEEFSYFFDEVYETDPDQFYEDFPALSEDQKEQFLVTIDNESLDLITINFMLKFCDDVTNFLVTTPYGHNNFKRNRHLFVKLVDCIEQGTFHENHYIKFFEDSGPDQYFIVEHHPDGSISGGWFEEIPEPTTGGWFEVILGTT